jgi:hypothetical protein
VPGPEELQNLADNIAEENQSQEEQSQPVTDYFARVPYAIFDARQNDELTGSMFITMVWLYKWADWSTGVIRRFDASRLEAATCGEFTQRTFEWAVQKLVVAGWLRSGHVRGSRKPFAVTICNYVALSGARKNKILNPSTIKSWRDSESADCADDCADVAVNDGADVGAEIGADVATNNTRDQRDFVSRDFPEPNENLKEKEGERNRTAPQNPPATSGSRNSNVQTQLPPQTVEIVKHLKNYLASLTLQFEPNPIPQPYMAQIRKSFLKDTDSIGVPFKQAVELYEQTVRASLTPAAPAPPKPKPLEGIELKNALVDTLTEAGEEGRGTTELVQALFFIAKGDRDFYKKRDHLVTIVAALRKKGRKIVRVGEWPQQRYVLKK